MGNYMAFDIGGTSVKYAVVNKESKIVEKGKIQTPKKDLNELVLLILNVISNYREKYTFEGLAMSFPGAVNNNTGFIGGVSAVPYIHGPNIREILEKETGYKVSLENDANCAALAEVWIGTAKGANDVLFVVCGTGIGGAVIKDRKIHTGKHLFGGEFGYMIMEKDYENETFKTWSDTGSTAALVKRVAGLKGIPEEELNGEIIFKLAEEGDEICKKSVDIFYRNLAEGIYNLQYCYDPDMIVIGGAVSAREELISELNKKIEFLNKRVPTSKLKINIKRCEFSNDANIIGAVYNFINTFSKTN
ncbi:MAG: ROK family protein [Clostridiaceae bacterium]